MAEQASRKRIGIFGGSFNPIHMGHICLARQILIQASLDEIWFVVSPLNPFKQNVTNLLPDDARLELTREALKGEHKLVVSDYEFGLPRPSYMWNTLAHLLSVPTIGLPLTVGRGMNLFNNIIIFSCILARVIVLTLQHYHLMSGLFQPNFIPLAVQIFVQWSGKVKV